jgi:hypothetical protein
LPFSEPRSSIYVQRKSPEDELINEYQKFSGLERRSAKRLVVSFVLGRCRCLLKTSSRDRDRHKIVYPKCNLRYIPTLTH